MRLHNVFRKNTPNESIEHFTIPDSMPERSIDCNRTPDICGLGKSACTMYMAVWFGGTCGNQDCGNGFVQGKFIGNLEGMVAIYDDGSESEPSLRDEPINTILEEGFTIRPV